MRFSKPANREEAASNCAALRGKTHALHSALALVRDDKVLFEMVDTARLTMRDFSDRFLDDYLDMAGDAALSSVGGYQLEGIGIHLFERVEGDYFTILGLPLLPLLAYLREERFCGRLAHMFILGLTGSIGMGKSATAKMFADEGVPVHDADAVVHRLYEGEATPLIEAAFPGTTSGGKVDRGKLGQRVLGDDDAMTQLEQIVHPLVTQARERFLAEAEAQRRAGRGARYSAAVRDRRRSALRRGGGGLGAGRGAARTRVRAPRHDRGEIRRHSGQADAGRRQARPRRFRGGYVAGIRRRPHAGA